MGMGKQCFGFPALYLLLLPSVFLISCGCLIGGGGGGDTGRAEQLGYAHKGDESGIGGPAWPLLKRLGARLTEETQPGVAALIRGIQKVHVANFTLDGLTEERRNEIFALYERALNAEKPWVVLTRRRDDSQESCIYARYDQDSLRGLFVLNIEDNKLNVIQFLGDIRPPAFVELNEHLGKLGIRLPVAEVLFEN